MFYHYKSTICQKISQVFNELISGGCKMKPSEIAAALRIAPKCGESLEYDFIIKGKIKSRNVREINIAFPIEASKLVSCFPTDEIVNGVYIPSQDSSVESIVKLKVCHRNVIRDCMEIICSHPAEFWQHSPLLKDIQHENIIVEFSSPNIAKPFHMGNLKSTIIGNFLSRLFEAVGHKVTRINYLGDWGTQFGLLKYGYSAQNFTESDLETEAVRKLCSLYVWANHEVERNPEIFEKAKYIFSQMENGNPEMLATWKMFRDISIKELKAVYSRFNIFFDEYHGESMYNKAACNETVNLMTEKGILERVADGRMMYKPDTNQEGVTITKSDGSTLYLTRDITAAIHRHRTFKFDKMFYVVDNSQTQHFKDLIRILKDLDLEFAENIIHVGYGRIAGMSTRKGTAVTLEDILEDGIRFFRNKQDLDKDTPTDALFERSKCAEKLVVSALITSAVKERRKKNTTFKWEDVLRHRSGSNLHYANCRLLRLEENCGVSFNPEVDVGTLVESEVIDLIRCIAHCEITTAYKRLPVKNVPVPVAEARLKLFRTARYTLVAGMKILGIEPLERM